MYLTSSVWILFAATEKRTVALPDIVSELMVIALDTVITEAVAVDTVTSDPGAGTPTIRERLVIEANKYKKDQEGFYICNYVSISIRRAATRTNYLGIYQKK